MLMAFTNTVWQLLRMMNMSKKVRIEIRFDEVEDKEMIDFIDKYGSTRAGFIKQALKVYKKQIEGSIPTVDKETVDEPKKEKEYNSKRKKLTTKNDIAFSSKDI